MKVTAVSDGGQAALHHAQGGFDLVLMDLHMPRVSGLEAVQMTRESQRSTGCRRTPVIALTASATVEDRRRCMDAGMDDFLSKPLRAPELLNMLERHLGLSKWTTAAVRSISRRWRKPTRKPWKSSQCPS